MTALDTTLEMTRPGIPRFLTDDALRVGQPVTRCMQQLWCSPRAAGPTAHADDQMCDTSCLRQLGLTPGFTPLVD
jgi:hypothetical protein